ncbi:MAG: hypothetical protein RJB66_1922 [Pseudomonadota bacterium]
MADNTIEIKNLEFTYSGGLSPALSISELKVLPGQKVFIYGPSGSGKTTLLEVLSGVLEPQKGFLKVAGVDLLGLSNSQRDQFRAQNIGYVFQTFNLLPYLTVIENIELPIHLTGKTIKNFQGWQKRLIERLGLVDLIDRSVQNLSVGQQQRVAVARALLGKPAILLADEPTSSLDSENRESFLQLLFELAKEVGTTVIFVSHDRSLEPLFDRCIPFSELNRDLSGVVK